MCRALSLGQRRHPLQARVLPIIKPSSLQQTRDTQTRAAAITSYTDAHQPKGVFPSAGKKMGLVHNSFNRTDNQVNLILSRTIW